MECTVTAKEGEGMNLPLVFLGGLGYGEPGHGGMAMFLGGLG